VRVDSRLRVSASGFGRRKNPSLKLRWYYAALVEDGLVDRIKRAFAGAVNAQMEPIRLEVTRAQHEELSRQYGVPEGLRIYRGRPVVIASEFCWVTA
jgi:hypothetical protein